MTLAQKHCTPCEGLDKALSKTEALQLLKDVPGWQINADYQAIFRIFLMKNFMAAINLIEKIAVIAENENHHPNIHLSDYRNLRIELSTHALKGLTENDFIVAARINQLPLELKV